MKNKSNLKMISLTLITVFVIALFVSCSEKSVTHRFNGLYIDKENVSNIEFIDGKNCTFYINKNVVKGTYEITEKTLNFKFNIEGTEKEYIADIVDEYHLMMYEKNKADKKEYIKQ
ncbi:MAG: hypothetical protein RR549_03515 [Oscillospiraceae bacterium]